MNTCRRWPA